MGVADHESDGHRLPEGPPETEHDAPDHAHARVWQYDVPDYLPSRRPQTIGGLLEHVRYGLEDIARHRGDERQHHDREHEASREHPDAEGWALEQKSDERERPDVLD